MEDTREDEVPAISWFQKNLDIVPDAMSQLLKTYSGIQAEDVRHHIVQIVSAGGQHLTTKLNESPARTSLEDHTLPMHRPLDVPPTQYEPKSCLPGSTAPSTT